MSAVGELEPAIPHGRKNDRSEVRILASLRKRGATAVEVELKDLSTHGFRIESIHVLQRGDYVWLKIEGLAPLDAHVAWFRDYAVGCEFVTPLHPAVLDRIIATAR